jgi:Holliday junction resolvase RusA-like endonuclease
LTDSQDIPSDTDRALALVSALHAPTDRFEMLVVDGEPASKARPRFARNGHAYTPKATETAQEVLAWRLRAAIPRPYPSNVAVGCVFFRPNRQRIDADNMLKLVLDAATGVVWEDDSQVTGVMGVVELDAENPRTLIVFAEHQSSMTRGFAALPTCAFCGVKFKGTSPRAKFCSQKCQGKARAKLRERDCLHCGKAFQPENSYRKLCSPECRADSLRAKRRAKAGPAGRCGDCGCETSKPEYRRCRECWKLARARGIDDPAA